MRLIWPGIVDFMKNIPVIGKFLALMAMFELVPQTWTGR
jgi:hypothetical protein